MFRRTMRTTIAAIAIVVLLAAVAAPSVWAKGRPTRAEIATIACGSLTVSATWWKKLNVQGIQGEVYLNGEREGGIFFETNSTGLTSPWSSFPVTGLTFSLPTTTYSVVLSLYADTTFQTLLDTATSSSATISCGL